MNTALSVPQSKFHKLKVKFPLFVGGYGSGKTFMLEVCAVQDMLENPGANIAMYCPTFDLLKLNLIPRIQERLSQLKLFHFLHKGDHIITVMGMGSFIFRSMENPDRIIGYEVFRSHCDEIDLLPQKKAELVWNRIIARNRQKLENPLWRRARIRFENGSKSVTEHKNANKNDVYYVYKGQHIFHYKRNKVSAYTTPESFGFTYNRWKKSPARGYAYVVAPTYSNKHLEEDYIESLRDTYTDKMIQAYIEGLWVNLTTGSVYPYFDRDIHHTDRVHEEGEAVHLGLDFNVGKMSAIHFAPVKTKFGQRRPVSVEIINEIVGYPDTPALIKAINKQYKDCPIFVYPDAAGKNRNTTNVTVTDHKLLKKAGFVVRKLTKNPLVRDRVASVNKLFEEDILYVNTETCPELTNALEQQAYDEHGKPDKSSDLDHPLDAMGYRICYSWLISKPALNYKQAA